MSLLARLRARSAAPHSEPALDAPDPQRRTRPSNEVSVPDAPVSVRSMDPTAVRSFGSQFRVRRSHDAVCSDRAGVHGKLAGSLRPDDAEARAQRHLGREVLFGEAP
ncbi:hypothetical protein P0W64_15060 [Tsukamurella sp. 8F]|uniref:hypothetical protein n=1 Tax=unclassified Tsukamurella TaxID=2633480 RepID=UPI0023B8CDDA|nr:MULTISPECIES: hypothetical protein [unclassified Tsukamurella]MDF0532527.1 hypothetical protein [Tsukamurella sp. 8J]MDF0588097.1 hypothetical protein [Tsukamurella sp. 8F]